MKMNKLADNKPIIRRKESGQALIIVLVLLMVGSLILSPVLSLINNSLKDGQLYDRKMNESYAAKSGIEDATWQIKNAQLDALFHNPDYNTYDYNTVWSYSLNEQINNLTTNVSIQNIWLPKDLPIPNPGEAKSIIDSNKLIVTGDTIETSIILPDSSKISEYRAKITYYPEASENLTVASFGVWLPRGFVYYTDSTHKCSLQSNPISDHPVMVTTSQWAGNQALIWSYSSPPTFLELPAGGTLPLTADITFYFKPSDQTQPNLKPDAVPWIKTANGSAYGIPYSWDADIKVYKVRSVVDATMVESYFAKSELRQLQQAISGDYYATGNSNLSASGSSKQRTVWHDPSTAAVTSTNIPPDADVAYAFLYWSGWKSEDSITSIFSDSCSSLPGNWTWNASTSTWSANSGSGNPSPSFRGNYGGTHTVRDLTLASPRDLSAYSTGGVVTLSWDQWVTSPQGNQSVTSVPASDDSNTGGFTTSPLWSRVDETTPVDSDYITGITDGGGRATFGFNAFTLPASANITNLTIYFRHLATSSSGSAKAGVSLKVGNTYYDNLGMVTPSSYSWTTSSYIASNNPKTGQPWTVDDINGTGANPLQKFGVSSNDFSPDVRFSMVYAEVNYTITVSANDGLDYYLSKNGTSWSGAVQAFRGNIGTSPTTFSTTIPTAYLTSGFKIKFSLVGFSGTGQYANLDNITIEGESPDTSVVFKIDAGTGYKQVYFDANGNPQQGSQELTASRGQLLRNYADGNPHGYSYSSFKDVTALVRKYSKAPTQPATNWPGYATYGVGGISASTSPSDEWAYANWSLIIIYTSQATQGHQLYLFDKFIYSNQDTDHGVNVDFDGDGLPGGYISGFIVPERITGVAGITVTSGGSGYTSPPTVTVTGNGSGATAVAAIAAGKVTAITVTDDGHNYTTPPTVLLTGGGGGGATAQALLDANAAKMTCFVGEGDIWYDGDYVAMNGTKLWDGTNTTSNSKSNPNNVFNSTSMGLGSYDGIDIDTLGIDPPNGQYITWASNILKPGDTSAQVDMVTHTDVWNVIYIILSFRSKTTMGGILSYRIVN